MKKKYYENSLCLQVLEDDCQSSFSHAYSYNFLSPDYNSYLWHLKCLISPQIFWHNGLRWRSRWLENQGEFSIHSEFLFNFPLSPFSSLTYLLCNILWGRSSCPLLGWLFLTESSCAQHLAAVPTRGLEHPCRKCRGRQWDEKVERLLTLRYFHTVCDLIRLHFYFMLAIKNWNVSLSSEIVLYKCNL